jgi:hypothetical protein
MGFRKATENLRVCNSAAAPMVTGHDLPVPRTPGNSTPSTNATNPGGSACCCTPILPGDPPTPCPTLLTEEEAIRYLRLDTINIENPSATLKRYRDMGLLRATQVSKRLFYLRTELDAFLQRLTDLNPR